MIYIHTFINYHVNNAVFFSLFFYFQDRPQREIYVAGKKDRKNSKND